MTTRVYVRKLNRYLALGGLLLAANIAMAQDGAKLIGHWSLDGNAVDSAGANNGFLFGIGNGNPELPTVVSGKFGDALAFNGGVGVEVPIDLDYRTHQALTITMWVNLNGSKRGASAQTLVSTGTGSGPNISLSRDQLRATGGGKSVGPRRSLTADDWNFIAVSWDHQSGQLWMHVNNVEAHYPINYQNKRSQGMYFSPRDPDAELHGRKAQKRYLWLGSKDNSGKVYSLEGVSIDDVRIYDGILAAEELDQLSEGKTSGLVSDRFDPNRIPGDQYDPAQLPGDQYDPRALPGDQYDPAQLPGDQYDPRALPGDQYDPAQLPGDQYDPRALPGDQYDPAQLPGDQYEPAQIPGNQFEPNQVPTAEALLPLKDIVNTQSCSADSECPAIGGLPGACYSIAGNPAKCYQRCDNDSDCGEGNSCDSVTLPSSLLDGVCNIQG